MQKNKVAIIIPCFNERETIFSIYKDAKKYGKVLVIDDCSTDGTSEILRKKKIKILKNNRNIGYEASIIKGMKHISKNWKNTSYIVTLDADGELPTKSIPLLINKLIKKELDIVIGSRNKTNRFTETILKFFFYLRYNIKDPISGLKVYRLKSLKKVINSVSTKLFLVDILIISIYRNFLVQSCEIEVKKRKGRAKVGSGILVNIKIINIIFKSFFLYKKS